MEEPSLIADKVNTLTDHFSSVFTDKGINTEPTLNNNLYSDIQPFDI